MVQQGNPAPLRTITLEEHYASAAFMQGPGRQLKEQAQAARAHSPAAAALAQAKAQALEGTLASARAIV